MVKVETSTRYEYIVNTFVGQEIVLDENNKIIIDDISSYKNRVIVKYVPWEFDNGVLKRLLERYGRVENIIDCVWKYGDYKGVPNDEKIVWMVVDEPIPSSLFISETQSYFHFRYDTQPPACLKCGSLIEHKAYLCDIARTLKPDRRDNAVNLGLDVFPDTMHGSNEDTEVNTDNEDSRSNISSDSGSSQDSIVASATNSVQVEQPVEYELSFVCTECDYRSKSKTEFDSHMTSHKEEKAEEPRVTYASKIKSPKPKVKGGASQVGSSQDFGFISASQPVIGHYQRDGQQIRKRQQSLSPSNVFQSASRPKYI